MGRRRGSSHRWGEGKAMREKGEKKKMGVNLGNQGRKRKGGGNVSSSPGICGGEGEKTTIEEE